MSIPARVTSFVRATWPLVSLVLIVGFITLACTAGDEELQRRATIMLINLVFVVGLYVFVGNSGVLSFGHASFMAIGAYTAGLITARIQLKHILIPDAPDWIQNAHFATIPAVLLAGITSATLALILAFPLMRLSGLAAGIATLAVLIIVKTVLSQWDSLTGGLTALNGIPTDIGLYAALIWSIVAIVFAYLYQGSRYGLRLKASREDEIAARSVGISVVRERAIAFVLSGFLVGLSGALYAHFLGSITPDLFYFQITFLTIAMLVVGGMTSLAGAVTGTIFIAALQEGLRNLEKGPSFVPARPGLTEVGLAIVLIVVLIYRPKGLTKSREITWPFSRSSGTHTDPGQPGKTESGDARSVS